MTKCADKNAETPRSAPLVAPLVEVPEADPGIVKADETGMFLAGKSHAFCPRVETASVGRPLKGPPGPCQPMNEFGGPPGPEPTRFGDWEKKGRCIDF
jgi:hypothetical protein